ncbi:MAG: chemotaxis protein CheA [Gemmataceae bacterium]
MNFVTDNDSSNFDEYLSDYVAECDEHLTAAGRTLLAIESSPALLDRTRLDELFRNFHTVKGLSAMVGLVEAERLAHAVESYLSQVRQQEGTLTVNVVAKLIQAVQMLESIVSARQLGRAIPDVEPVVRAIGVSTSKSDAGSGTRPAVSLPADKRLEMRRAIEKGERAWRVVFASSAAMAERGINVNWVRDRLQSEGNILSAQPIVTGPGQLNFEFIVTASHNLTTQIMEAGISVEPVIFDSLPQNPEDITVPSTGLAQANLVRVDLSRLDDLMRTLGDLVVTRARLDNGLKRVVEHVPDRDRRELLETGQILERHLRALREDVMRIRLVSVRDLFGRMHFVVRDLTRETGKQVELKLHGEDTQIDKFIVDRLSDPLLHMVRNAVTHGLEMPHDRTRAGKSAKGSLSLRAKSVGGAVLIEVEDDGHGIDSEWIASHARALGLCMPEQTLTSTSILDLLCTPGFTTSKVADRASGRGVGMDVVRRTIESLGGYLSLETIPHQGTRFSAMLPLTLAIADALIVTVGTQTYAIPQVAITEVIQVEPGATIIMENNELLQHREGVLPLIRLTDLFETERLTVPFPAMIVGAGKQAIAVGVDRILGLREIVVHTLTDPLLQLPAIAGVTELGDGRAVLILDAMGLSRLARQNRSSNA